MPKVFVGALMHESHGFCLRPTTMADYEAYQLARGPGLLEMFSGSATELGGFLAAADTAGWAVVPGLAASAWPAGPLTAGTFTALLDEMAEGVRQALPLDGVYLALHGSMSAEGCDDAEGEILSRVRAVTGPDLPLAVSLDLHANVSEAMSRQADVLTAYRTTPHIDMAETGARAAGLLGRLMAGERLVTRRSQWPMLAGLDLGRTIDPSGPMPQVLARARELEATQGIHEISICAGYSYGDKACAGPSVLVVCDPAATTEADAIGDELNAMAWQTRAVQTIEFRPMAEIIDRMRAALRDPLPGGPLIVADYSDGVAGGGYGDGTRLLQAMIGADLRGAVYGIFHDPVFAKAAIEAGPGAGISGQLGGRGDPAFGGGPIPVSATVMRLSDGKYRRKGPFATGTPGDLGPSALVDIAGIRVTVCTARMQPEDREQFRIFGITPESERVLAFKGINHFRADFEPIAGAVAFVDTGGLVSPDLRQFPYRRVRRPVWPLDDIPDPRPGQARP